jgi:hypothetical protein
MNRRFRDLPAKTRAGCQVAADAGDETCVYCTACKRAMKQGDCTLDELDGSLECAYDDCRPEGNLAFKSLYGWDAYRLAHGQETAQWPQEPDLGECYEQAGASP